MPLSHSSTQSINVFSRIFHHPFLSFLKSTQRKLSLVSGPLVTVTHSDFHLGIRKHKPVTQLHQCCYNLVPSTYRRYFFFSFFFRSYSYFFNNKLFFIYKILFFYPTTIIYSLFFIIETSIKKIKLDAK